LHNFLLKNYLFDSTSIDKRHNGETRYFNINRLVSWNEAYLTREILKFYMIKMVLSLILLILFLDYWIH